MKKILIKTLAILLIFILVISFSSCNMNNSTNNQLTMYVGLGNTSADYCNALHQIILDKTGIDVKFIYNTTMNTTSAMINRMKNNDLPADIMVNARRTDDDIQKNAFLDLASYTNLTDLFLIVKIRECAIDGAVYQIPFTSRLIGIEYNKTLLEEMGWELPKNYNDMLELKKQVEEAGYIFAVSANYATGHGFNYLFHTMGSQFICSPDGSEWFRNFQSGKESVDIFKTKSEYFKKYAESGLFGEIYSSAWNAGTIYTKVRALFYYNIINDVYTYDGLRYNMDGTVYGAEYDSDGNLMVTPDDNGNIVLFNNEYVLFDSNNQNHADLQRYTVQGSIELHDVFASMPWITESGSSNSFTVYDNMYVSLDKSLGKPENREKLTQAIKVLECLTCDEAASLYSDLYVDGYIATNNYIINDSRLYSEFSEDIKNGYIITWFYNSFDDDSIVFTGELVNKYLRGEDDVSFDDIFTELELRRDNYLNGKHEILANVTETLDYSESAKLQAIANGMSLQTHISLAGITTDVTASIVPYIDSLDQIPLFVSLGVVQEKVYAGPFDSSTINMYVNINGNNPIAVKMSGSELKSLIEKGYIYTDKNGNQYVYKYACVTKYNIEINDDDIYTVAVSDGSIDKNILLELKNKGNVIEGISGTTIEGLTLFTSKTDIISKDTLIWN